MKLSIIGPAIVGVIAVSTLVGAFALIRAAHGDRSFAVEPGYYEKAQRWDDEAKQRRANAALGWTIECDCVAQDGVATVRARLLDAKSEPISMATLTCEVFPNARASSRQDILLAPIGDGVYEGTLACETLGSWHWRFRAIARGQTFTHDMDAPIVSRQEAAGGRKP